ncbi:MAG TPA: EscU/YscU/HrcU family type III secretion system export apparatus switch protein [Symbiobacteriaceae bacterium]
MAGQHRKSRKAAVALGYDPASDHAPQIIAAGRGEMAEALVRIAQKYHVPVHTDHPLAEALVRLDVGEAIPPELYAAVAEVLAFLWRLEQEKSAQGGAFP